MEVYLDEAELRVERPTLACALQAGARVAEANGRVIIEAWLDGQALDEQTLADPPDEPVGRRLRLVSADPRLLVFATLQDAADVLEALKSVQAECAAQIQADQLDQAMTSLGQVLATWQAVQQAFQRSTELVPLDADDMDSCGVEEGERGPIQALATQLRDLRDALERQDWSTVADGLEHDLSALADRWSAMLRAAADRARQGR